MKTQKYWWFGLLTLLVLALILAACGGDEDPTATPVPEVEVEEPAAEEPAAEEPAAEEPVAEATELSLWYHGAGNEEERAVILQIIEDFNGSQDQWAVDIEDFPQATYNESIVAAYLQPLNLSAGAIDGFLPGAIGEWDGELYSVGLWDAAKGMYARRSVLEDNGIRIPTLDEPWTGEEFDAALETLQATGDFDFAFDPGMNWTGEWYPYAFSPFLQSFGGDIIDRSTYLTAEGVLNGEEAIAFGEWWQSIFERGLAPGTSQDAADRDTGFLDGKYALQWNGNWAAVPALEAFGDDMVFLPAPDFGHGPTIGAGSWQFGISADSEHPDGANAFVEFAIQDKYSAAFSDVLGLAPTTLSAAALTENYAPGGPLEVFFGLSQAQALIRPPTPAYLSAALTFEKAMADIANGADVIDALDAAVDEIDADIEANVHSSRLWAEFPPTALALCPEETCMMTIHTTEAEDLAGQKQMQPRRRLNDRQQESLAGWLMAAPAILLILGFLIIPFVLAFGLAFTNQRLISPNPTEYVGTRNFARLLKIRTLSLDPIIDEATGEPVLDEDGNLTYPRVREFTRNNPEYPELDGLQEWLSLNVGDTRWVLLAGDTVFMKSLVNTFYFALVVVPFQAGLALLLALLVNQGIRGINIFRTIYFIPVVVSMVVVALLWRFIYDGQNGLLNNIISFFTLGAFEPVDWIGNPATAMPAIIGMSIWQGVGFHMIIWLAGLQTIPGTLYEAAAVEGAGAWDQFRYVTWPGLRPTAIFVLVTITIAAFGLFTQIDVMTRGGPLDSTTTVIFQMVQRGYEKQDIAGGSAISVIFFIMVLIVALTQRFVTRERD
jgi:multiple sugar transport system substrate-binding protein